MSRTKKGSKPPGYEYWTRRPASGCVPGTGTKQLTHQIERAQGRQELHRELNRTDKAPHELEYDEREYVPGDEEE